MNQRRTPMAAVLDLLVYTPVGLAVTVGEELPKLAAKGRAKVGPQVSTARLVGQFAVTEGRRRAGRLVDRPEPTRPAPASPVPASHVPAPAPPGSTPSAPTASAALHQVADPPAPPPATVRRPAAPAGGTLAGGAAHPAGGDAPSADDLAIPGYDSLSASQVVQRLAGLGPTELAAVGAYEASTRGRRTVLARVAQLQNA